MNGKTKRRNSNSASHNRSNEMGYFHLLQVRSPERYESLLEHQRTDSTEIQQLPRKCRSLQEQRE